MDPRRFELRTTRFQSLTFRTLFETTNISVEHSITLKPPYKEVVIQAKLRVHKSAFGQTRTDDLVVTAKFLTATRSTY